MTPAEAGAAVAATWPPLTEQQVADAARVLAAVARERATEPTTRPSTPSVPPSARP